MGLGFALVRSNMHLGRPRMRFSQESIDQVVSGGSERSRIGDLRIGANRCILKLVRPADRPLWRKIRIRRNRTNMIDLGTEETERELCSNMDRTATLLQTVHLHSIILSRRTTSRVVAEQAMFCFLLTQWGEVLFFRPSSAIKAEIRFSRFRRGFGVRCARSTMV